MAGGKEGEGTNAGRVEQGMEDCSGLFPELADVEDGQGNQTDSDKRINPAHAKGRGEDSPEGGPKESSDGPNKGQPQRASAQHSNPGRRSRLKKHEVIAALKAADGDRTIAAAALGVTKSNLACWIHNHSDIRAVYGDGDASRFTTPTEVDLITRTKAQLPSALSSEPVGDQQLTQAMIVADREILRQGLKQAGIDEKTIDKLNLMEGFAVNTGRFLTASLDLTHRMTLLQGVALFEQAEKIKKYINDEALDHEVRIGWQRAYNEICELIGKTSDRIIAATNVGIALMRKKDEGEGKSKGKPGFSPLIKQAEQAK